MFASLLRRVSLFASLPEFEINALSDGLVEKVFDANIVLFSEGEKGDKFFVVVEGQVEIIKSMGSDHERIIGLKKTGDFIGEMSLLNPDGLRTASVRTLSTCRLLEMSRADFNNLLYRVPTIAYEMSQVLSLQLNAVHNAAIRELVEKNTQLAEAYAELQEMQEQIIQKEILDRELLKAREIQESILPSEIPVIDGLDIGVQMLPARMVGGDFYDVIQLDSNHLGLVVGDVSGKGVPAALFMALTCALLRAEANSEDSPDQVLLRVNQQFRGMNTNHMFATVFYGVFNIQERVLTYVRAGHEYPMVWNSNGRVTVLDNDNGHPLGLFKNPILQNRKIKLEPGSLFFVYSDGVTEAENETQDFFGMEGLEKHIPSFRDEPTQQICEHILEAILNHQGTIPQSDDITLMGLRVL